MATTQPSPAQWTTKTLCTAFKGPRCIASGELSTVAIKAKDALDHETNNAPLLIFDDQTSEQIEVDFRGTGAQVLSRIPDAESPRMPGRPKLGVVAREITLLPRHWSWLSNQPGGASVALRKLVETALRDPQGKEQKRIAQETTYRFMSAMAGDRAGFEEATRALFAGDAEQFQIRLKSWPAGIRKRAGKLAEKAFKTDPGD